MSISRRAFLTDISKTALAAYPAMMELGYVAGGAGASVSVGKKR